MQGIPLEVIHTEADNHHRGEQCDGKKALFFHLVGLATLIGLANPPAAQLL